MAKRHHLRGSRRRQGALVWPRLVLALAIMLLAVLPHATLAARHAAPATGHGQVEHATAEPAPCHEAAGQRQGQAAPDRAIPSCCILGCGLLGQAPALPGDAVATGWRRLAPASVLAKTERAPEPAERPPRPAAA